MAEEPVVLRRKKSGFPNQSAFDNSQLIHSFSKINRALVDLKIFPHGLKVDEQSLTNISFQLQAFMESTFGKNAPKSSKSITKIPLGAFRDFSVDGSMMIILSVALKRQMKAGWKTFDLTKPDRFDEGVEIIRDAEAALLSSRMLRRPKIFMGRIPEHAIPKLILIVTQHGGSVVDEVIGASHVVDWDEEVDSLASELTEEFVRTLEVRPSEEGGTSLVHWYYHPDSYDEWIPSDHVDGSEPPDTVPQSSELNTDRQWLVCCRFVMDCDIFNEWGNEIDYESIPEGEGEDDENDEAVERSPVKTSSGRKARGRRRLEAIKAKKVPILESILVTEKMMQDVPPPLYDFNVEKISIVDILVGECQLKVVKHEGHGAKTDQSDSKSTDTATVVEEAEDSVAAAAIVGTKRKSDEEAPIGDSARLKESSSAAKQKKEKSTGRKGSFQPQLKLPSWYNSELLNALEIKYLPDFFSTESDRLKNTGEYFRIRNFIVGLYAHNPAIYLSATDCRRKLSGDVCMVIRIHGFLDAFGVINFNLKADCRPVLAQASLSHWHENILTSSAPDFLSSSSVPAVTSSASSLGENCDVEWSEDMDISLRRYAVKKSGDWVAVAAAMAMEYSDCGEDQWVPTGEECLTRFVSLSIPVPKMSTSDVDGPGEGSATLALTNIAASSATQQMRYLSSQLAHKSVANIGRNATKKVVSSALSTLAGKDHHAKADVSHLTDTERFSPKKVAEEESLEQSLSSCDYVNHRLDSVAAKLNLIADVDRMIDLERERVEIDKRDVQMQRALLCFQPTLVVLR